MGPVIADEYKRCLAYLSIDAGFSQFSFPFFFLFLVSEIFT